MTRAGAVLILLALACGNVGIPKAEAVEPQLDLEQITDGPKHHFFGYIGHAGTCPWNRSGRYIIALQTGFQDHMPGADEAAEVILTDTNQRNAIRVVDRTRAWNFQQGTMLYWNPEAPETQFFFNDRDLATGPRFLRALRHHPRRKWWTRPGVSVPRCFALATVDAQRGGSFLGLNYGRLSRLRPVTGYPDAHDWTTGVNHPEDDGLFRVDAHTGEKQLLVSYRRIADHLRQSHPASANQALFLNHTLWNRDDDRIFFYARADFEAENSKRLDVLIVVNPDGTGSGRPLPRSSRLAGTSGVGVRPSPDRPPWRSGLPSTTPTASSLSGPSARLPFSETRTSTRPSPLPAIGSSTASA